MNTSNLQALTFDLIGAALEVHRELGPGLLESAYEAAYAHELTLRGFSYRRQLPVPIAYKGVEIDCGYRLDFLVEDYVVVGLKAVENLLPIHDAQVLTYLKLANQRLGLLINFNVLTLTSGVRRLVHQFPDFSANSADSAVPQS